MEHFIIVTCENLAQKCCKESESKIYGFLGNVGGRCCTFIIVAASIQIWDIFQCCNCCGVLALQSTTFPIQVLVWSNWQRTCKLSLLKPWSIVSHYQMSFVLCQWNLLNFLLLSKKNYSCWEETFFKTKLHTGSPSRKKTGTDGLSCLFVKSGNGLTIMDFIWSKQMKVLIVWKLSKT